MRIWDINPGYLNRQSLLGEHRELHGIVSIVLNSMKGYSRHPETIRWAEYGWALKMRHKQLSCEMALRGYVDRSPVNMNSNENNWPEIYIDTPERQFQLLKDKYKTRDEGRIPLPSNLQQLWSHHKYSVLARNQQLYRSTGRDVSNMSISFEALAQLTCELLREKPSEGGIRNSVQHMWGYVSATAPPGSFEIESWSTQKLLSETQKRTMNNGPAYLRSSTALSELMVWLPETNSTE